jgi:FkbM family methyltransferase
MKPIAGLGKPEYVFRPTQIWRRLSLSARNRHAVERVLLPWGASIKVHLDDSIGCSIARLGVYELCVTEALWRLIDLGETAVDVGANQGYMTSVMAERVGPRGEVHSFEPHPEVYDELRENIEDWRAERQWRQIRSYKLALSNRSGTGTLCWSSDFQINRGMASLADARASGSPEREVAESGSCAVSLAKLDDIMHLERVIGIVKIDVEGHELEVLEGAARLLENQVRDVLFEEYSRYPCATTQFLETKGFTLFALKRGFWKPKLVSPRSASGRRGGSWEPPNYLATKDADRALQRIGQIGWRSLSGG